MLYYLYTCQLGYLSLAVYLSFCLSVCLFISLPVLQSLYLFVDVFLFFFIITHSHEFYLVSLFSAFVCISFIYMSFCRSVCLPLCFFCCFIIFALSKDENKISYSSRVRISRPGFQHPLPPSIQNKMARLIKENIIFHTLKTVYPNIKWM